jgi:hypothetical protein
MNRPAPLASRAPAAAAQGCLLTRVVPKVCSASRCRGDELVVGDLSAGLGPRRVVTPHAAARVGGSLHHPGVERARRDPSGERAGAEQGGGGIGVRRESCLPTRLVTLTLGDAVPARWVGDGRTSRNDHVGLIEVVAGQAEGWVPALGPPVGALDLRRHNGGSLGGRLMPPASGRSRQVRILRSGRPGSAPRWPPTGLPASIRPGRVARPTGSNLRALEWLAATIGRNRGQVECPGDRLDTHQAPPGREHRDQWRPWSLSQFVSHSPPFAGVHRRPRSACPRWSRTLADGGERWHAVLESV